MEWRLLGLGRGNAAGVVDYGDEAFCVTLLRPVCLIGANVAVARVLTASAASTGSSVWQWRWIDRGSRFRHDFWPWRGRLLTRIPVRHGPAPSVIRLHCWHQGHGVSTR